ncbi:hypothetical protein [Methylococcus sp. EFPC2]|uniref:hypothetical protein n=1 Tax=Methylococcus sp. EFPC2 TaxID=2812648 RepID=UPI0019684850|nr:hypothetical protein [Methylococcus sp. EFPC2]QSA96321.1 hypothetical protein JWZ97_13970 [Methylococcus sp. EFPC2]
MNRLAGLVAIGALPAFFVLGCASLPPPAPSGSREAECLSFLGEMDERVAEHGVEDSGAARIAGFPQLRIDRFLASFASEHLEGAAYVAWLERLRKLDERARLIELNNLPTDAAQQVRAHAPSGLTVEAAIKVCGEALDKRDLATLARRQRLLAHAVVPDAYSTWQRVLGLYPLTRWAAVNGVARLHRELRAPFIFPRPALPAAGRLVHYAPAPEGGPEAAAGIFDELAADALGIPQPNEAQLDRLYAAYAPVWAVDTASDADRIGTVRLDAAGVPQVEVSAPAVYRWLSHVRWGERSLLQLNYLAWFPARPPASRLDIYAGRFDGLIWRVTLAPDGRPLAYDSIHPCGCYYQIFPGEGVRVAQPKDGSEPVLSPAVIPLLQPGERIVIHLSSGTHFIQGVTLETGTPPAAAYVWRDYDELRSLAGPDGRRHGLFGPDGLVRESERPERFLFWPMGIPSAGAMRQPGNHAIAFLGRRHFDDPRLLDKLLRPIGR